MKTKTRHPDTRVQNTNPRVEISIVMRERVGGDIPSTARIAAMRKKMQRECPFFLSEKH